MYIDRVLANNRGDGSGGEILSMKQILAFVGQLLRIEAYSAMFGIIVHAFEKIASIHRSEHSNAATTQILKLFFDLIVENFEYYPNSFSNLISWIITHIIGVGEKALENRAIVFDALKLIFSTEKLKSLFADADAFQLSEENGLCSGIYAMLGLFLTFRMDDNYIGRLAEMVKINGERMGYVTIMAAMGLQNMLQPQLLDEDDYLDPVLTSAEGALMFHFFGSFVAAMEQMYPDWPNVPKLRNEMKKVLDRLSVVFLSANREMQSKLIGALRRILTVSATLMGWVDIGTLVRAVAGDSDLLNEIHNIFWPDTGKPSDMDKNEIVKVKKP
jgi:hypothetical protein